MQKQRLFFLGFWFLLVAVFCFSYLDQLNHIAQLKIDLMRLAEEVREVKEENDEMQFQIEQAYSPDRLLMILNDASYSHFRLPYLENVIIVKGEIVE